MKGGQRKRGNRMDMKEITMICAVYNMEGYIGECLQSMADQTYSDFKLILVDDCSTDDSLSICRQFQKDHPDMEIEILVNESNLGVSGSWERGVLASNTPWIYIIDADDFVHPQLLEVGMGYVHSAECAGVDILQTRIVENNSQSLSEYQWQKIGCPPAVKLSKDGDTMDDYWSIMDGLGLGKSFIRRELFGAVDWQEYKKRWPRRFFNTGLFSFTLFHAAGRVGFLDEPLYIYRIRKNSTGRGLDRYDHLRDWVETDVEMMQNLLNWGEIKVADACLPALMQQIMRLCYYMKKNHVMDPEEFVFLDEQYRAAYSRMKKSRMKCPLVHRVSYGLFYFNKKLWCMTVGNLYFGWRYRICSNMKTKFSQ